MQSIELRVKKIISEQLECDIDHIGDDTFFYAAGSDQIDINKLVMLLEKEFHILILDEELETFINARTVIDYIGDISDRLRSHDRLF